jgi:hypothetical protein
MAAGSIAASRYDTHEMLAALVGSTLGKVGQWWNQLLIRVLRQDFEELTLM